MYDPYHDRRTYHMAKLISPDGDVSPLCAKIPRKLNLKRHQLWTILPEQVTCPRCRIALGNAGRPRRHFRRTRTCAKSARD